jgi:CRP/FNR family transcriptional regulator, anaerobic regulatory protein
MRPRTRCADCANHHKGLCKSINTHEVNGAPALDQLHGPVRVYDANDLVYAQGDASEHVFNLISGWVALYRDLADGRRHIIQILLPGAMFGVEPEGEALGHGAMVLTNAAVCPIPWTKLTEMRAQIPALNERFVRMLEKNIHRAFDSLTTIAQYSAKERIGRLLRDLAFDVASEAPILAGAAIRIPLTQRHIAEATGLTTIHVNRVLRQLREERVVSFQNGLLVVVDPRKLAGLTEPGVEVERDFRERPYLNEPMGALRGGRPPSAPVRADLAFSRVRPA